MKGMALLSRSLGALFLALAMQAASAALVAGRDYVALSPPQPVETGDKIEVLEAFSYACPHCYVFEPKLSAWAKSLPADVVVRKLPVSFNRPDWANLTRVYYTLEVLGEAGKLHGKVFDAIHAENIDLAKPEVLFDWAAKQGIERKKFADAYNSFTVTTKAARLAQLTRNYGVESVPSIIVDGKYRVTGGASHEDMLRIASELIQLVRTTHAPKAADAAPPTALLAKHVSPAIQRVK